MEIISNWKGGLQLILAHFAITVQNRPFITDMNYQEYQHVDSESQESPENLTQECETWERETESYL